MKQVVVFVSTVFDDVNTGPGIYARYLWEAFRDDDEIEFHVVAPSLRSNHPHLHSSGVGRSSLDTYRRVQKKAKQIVRSFSSTVLVHGNAAHSMSEFLGYPGPLIVQVNDYAAADAWRNPGSVIITKGLRRFLSLAWRRRQERKVVRSGSIVVSNSDHTAQSIIREYSPTSLDRFHTIYKAVDLRGFSNANTCSDPYPDRPRGARVVFVGVDWRIKGLSDLLRSIERVSRAIPAVHLTVAGPSREKDIRSIEKQISRLDLEDHVFLAGRVARKDLAGLYGHSDVLVLPSHQEALGVSLLEAMASGLPVIASKTGGIPEIVSHEVNGYLFPPGDSAQLARLLETLLSNVELRTKFRANGLETAGRFDVNRMVSAIRDLYVTTFADHCGGMS